MKITILTLIISLSSVLAASGKKPLALVWKGKGTCFLWCAPAAKKMAKKAGYRVRYITSRTKNVDGLLARASVWVQPGGQSITASKDMGPELMNKVRDFVYNGGGYVGYCAGMLLATERIGTKGGEGLGIIPGNTVHLFSDIKDRPYTLNISLHEYGEREIYFSGGPYLALENIDSSVKVMARYETGEIAAIETMYGAGKVSVAGYHPETPGYWKFLRGKKDRDGSDYFLAVQMMKSVKKIQN